MEKMTWKQFKDAVDKELKACGSGDHIKIDSIKIKTVDLADLSIEITKEGNLSVSYWQFTHKFLSND